jgi:uncharacterized protein YydD (DUF2326 family)
MIYEVFSDLPSFKRLLFGPHLNLLIADRSAGATNLQTRNRAGKTSFVSLVHFLLGGKSEKKESIFRLPDLEEFYFGMTFDLNGSRTRVRRRGKDASKVLIDADSLEEWPIADRQYGLDGSLTVSNEEWKTLLGHFMFGLPESRDERTLKYSPSFRSLFPYFARSQNSGGLVVPTKQSAQQQPYDQQVAILYLLELDWTIAQQWEEVRQREKNLVHIRRAASQGTLGPVIGSSADLRSMLAVTEERSRRLNRSVASFQVLDHYYDLEQEASRLARELGDLADANTVDQQLLSELEESLLQDVEPSDSQLERLYEEISIYLPDEVTRRFEQVRVFHRSVVENRRSYLGGAIQEATQRLASRRSRMESIARRQNQIMRQLHVSGALDQFVQLQSEVSRTVEEVESLRHRYEAAELLENQKTELDIERQQLLLRLRQDLREQADHLQRAILGFEEISRRLYEEAGIFTIKEGLNGPEFGFTIHGARSKGISNMQIFAFDMMIARLCATRGLGPGFLIHDSHLFDGVDERQIAKALQIGAEESENLGFQYIVTMNSDDLPHEDTSPPVDLDQYTLAARLTDAVDEGGLFGIRF